MSSIRTPRSTWQHYPPHARRPRSLVRIQFPAGNFYVAVPLGSAHADLGTFGDGLVAHPFGAWLIVEAQGPFPDEASVLRAAERALRISGKGLSGEVPEPLRS